MERKDLKALELEGETIDKIMALYGDSVNDLKSEKSNLEQDNSTLTSEVKSYKTQIKERDDQLEKLENQNGDVDSLKQTISELKQTNKEKDEDHQKLMKESKKQYEMRLALKESKARNERAALALLDIDEVTLNDDGELEGFQEQVDALKESDAYMFYADNSDEGAGDDKNDPPSSNYSTGDKSGNKGKDKKPGEIGRKFAEEIYGPNE